MRIKEDYSEEAAIAFNIIALIDIVFFLLIFFLAATTFAREERDTAVQLPGTPDLRPLSQPPRQMIINITADGGITVGGRECTRAQLAEMLSVTARDEPDREVLIRADELSLHRDFADVADICRRIGINPLKIGYLVRPETPVATN